MTMRGERGVGERERGREGGRRKRKRESTRPKWEGYIAGEGEKGRGSERVAQKKLGERKPSRAGEVGEQKSQDEGTNSMTGICDVGRAWSPKYTLVH